MNRMTTTTKKESLTNFLRNLDKSQKYFIKTDEVTGKRFAIAEFGEPGSVNIKCDFMTFEQMNAYLFGIAAVKNNSINLN